MIDQASVERAAHRFKVPDEALGRLIRRRDRKRRNRRITAGLVGIAVFVAAVLLVARAPLHSTNAPAATPTIGLPVSSPTVDPFSVAGGFDGLPPEGAAPSEPLHGELVASFGHVHPGWWVRVYADGRVIWFREGLDGDHWLERRLTPDGVHLVRSRPALVSCCQGHQPRDVPASAWEDAQAKQYVPARFAVCTSRDFIHQLPQGAQDLLGGYTNAQAVERGEVEFFAGSKGSTCPAVTVEEARQLDEVFLGLGLRRSESSGGSIWYEFQGMDPYLVVSTLLPDGTLAQCCAG